jgi:hypothetical protein
MMRRLAQRRGPSASTFAAPEPPQSFELTWRERSSCGNRPRRLLDVDIELAPEIGVDARRTEEGAKTVGDDSGEPHCRRLLRGLDQEANGRRLPLPGLQLALELFPPLARQRVELRVAPEIGCAAGRRRSLTCPC